MDNENQTVITHCTHFPAPKLARKCAITIDQLYVQIQEHTILHAIAHKFPHKNRAFFDRKIDTLGKWRIIIINRVRKFAIFA